MYNEPSVWVFHGTSAQITSGVFADLESATAWIRKHKLSGMITRYPLGQGFYDWAVEQEYFKPKEDRHRSPAFIQSFTCASAEHYQIEDGECSELEHVLSRMVGPASSS